MTDMDGQYRLVGLPRQAGHAIETIPPAGKPYLTSAKTTSTTTGLDPLKMDFDLKRGVLIRGRVTDKATGKPAPRAQVDYFAFVDNPHLRQVPGFRGSGHVQAFTAEDGSFTLVGLPGPGIVAAKAGRFHHYTSEDGRYVAGSGADEIKGPRDGSHFTTDPFICAAPLYHTLVGINPDKNAESITVSVLLDPGKTVTGKVLGLDGKPVAGVRMSSTWGLPNRQQDLKTAEFTVRAIDPKHPQPFFFHHKEKPLGAAVLLKGDEPKDFTIRLQPSATLTGRLLDDDGQPRAGVLISGTIESGQLNIEEGWGGFFNGTTDKEGRFEIKGLIPGLNLSAFTQQGARYTGRLFQQLTFKAREKRNLGDVKADTTGF